MELKQVIHFYLNCRCVNSWFPENHEEYNNNWTLTGVDISGHPKPYMLGNINHETRTDSIKPILRRIEDMTNEEWEEIRHHLSADLSIAANGYLGFCDKPKHVIILENRLQTNTLRFNDGIELIKREYDVFNLIKTNQAIDAKTLQP